MTKNELLKIIGNGRERGSQALLASKLNITTASVANWFSGRNYPTDENISRIAKAYKLDVDEVRRAFYEEESYGSGNIFTKRVETPAIKSEDNSRFVKMIPLTPNNTVQLPILADVPAGLPEYSDRDVEMFIDIPRFLFPGADFIVKCIGDSLEPKIHKGDFCVIRKMTDPLDGRAMLVKTESGVCMKVINKTKDGIELCSTNEKYKPFTPKDLSIIGLIIGHWSRDDKEKWA